MARPRHLSTAALLTAILTCAVTAWAADDTSTKPAKETMTKPVEMMLVEFSESTDTDGWHVQDDVVMGGRSQGAFSITEEGHAVFSGDVSLENNGGFSSVQWYFEPLDVSKYSRAVLRIKGDGKRYQFRVESNRTDRHAYVFSFNTSGDWETVEVPFAEMYPSWRGNRLDLPNYPGQTMAQARFLIGNERAESFRLEIESIAVR